MNAKHFPVIILNLFMLCWGGFIFVSKGLPEPFSLVFFVSGIGFLGFVGLFSALVIGIFFTKAEKKNS